MRIPITTSFLFLLLAGTAFGAPQTSAQHRIEELNAQSLSNLGISLNALRYLSGATPGAFIPLWHLQTSGEYAFIQELEKAGYAKVTHHAGLPDDQEKGTTFVVIFLLGEGLEIQKAMQGLQHNRSLKAGPLREQP